MDRGYADRLLDALTGLVGLGGGVALAGAVVLGDREVGLGTLYAALGLILMTMGLVAIELGLALRDLCDSIALAVQLARDHRDAQRQQRQRRLNWFAVELGRASAKGVPIQQAWDEALARCLPHPEPPHASMAA